MPKLPAIARSVTLAACLTLIGASLSACESSPKLTSAEERARTVPIQLDEFAALGYRVQWRGFPSMLAGETVERMDVLGDLVTVQDSGGAVSALEVSGGERRWSDQPADSLTKFVGVVRKDNRILVSSESEIFFYDSDTGAIVNKQRVQHVVNTRPALVGDVLVYGTNSGQVLGHLTLNGFRLWGATMRGHIEADPVAIGPSGVLGLVSQGGDVLLVDGATGAGQGRNRIYGGVAAPLGASETLLFVASLDHSLYAFSREGAMQVWRHRTAAPLTRAPVYHDGRVYCDLGEDGGLAAFDASSGKIAWSNKNQHGTVVAMRNGRLVVWDGSSASTLDPKSGVTVDTVRLDNVSIITAGAFADGDLYLASPNGVVTRLVPAS